MGDVSTEIFIPGNVPSLKNSKQWTGKYLVPSKTVSRYLKEHIIDYEKLIYWFYEQFKNKHKPYKISFKFIRGTKHKFDYVNAAQLPLDIMVDLRILDDDNADEVIPVFEPYEYSKENPGVIIKILN